MTVSDRPGSVELAKGAGIVFSIVPLAQPLDGHRMRVNWQMQASYAFGTYEPEVVQAVQRVVDPGCVAVDIA